METGVLLRERIAVRSVSLSTRLVLTAMVVGSAGVRFLLGLRRPTASYLPDEYTYSALARGIADTGRPAIRGVTVHFPSLLEPLLAAPAWLTGDPGLAFRLTQAEHAIVMSLAAIPVYLICKRLSLQNWVSLGAAGLALATPNLLYSSFIVSEPIAYPLLLAAVYTALVALEAPSKKAQLAFVVCAALATFARVQYLIVVPVLLVAALLVERGSLRRVVAKCGVALGVFAALGVVVLVSGPGRAAGVYGGLAHRHVSLASVGHQLGMHLLLVVFSSGVVLLPGALVGLGRGLARPLSAAEHAFSALTVVLAVALLADAVFIGAAVSGNYGERYLICLFPLLAPAFSGQQDQRSEATTEQGPWPRRPTNTHTHHMANCRRRVGRPGRTTYDGGHMSNPLVLPAGGYSVTAWLAPYSGGVTGAPRDQCSTQVTLRPLQAKPQARRRLPDQHGVHLQKAGAIAVAWVKTPGSQGRSAPRSACPRMARPTGLGRAISNLHHPDRGARRPVAGRC